MSDNRDNLIISYYHNYDDITHLIHKPYPSRQEEFQEQNIPFEAKLSYVGYSTGRSAINFEWYDKDRHRTYTSGIKFLDTCMQNELIKDGILIGKFQFRKRGTVILLDFYE